MSNIRWAIALLLMAVGAAPAAAQQGTIVGQVVDRATGQPLSGAQVFVVGTSRGALANQDGRYIIQQVPSGDQELRATLIGYASQSARVTVPAGATVTQNFQLAESAIELGAVVVQATGQQQLRREIGSSVGVIEVDEVELAPVSTFSDLLQGRSAGTTVIQASGTSGAGSRVRIRGSNSMSLSNDPLIVVDGIRVDNNTDSYGLFTGGQTASRLNDLNPQDIASIEILKGPAASALYGTAAANGVIQITTKRGTAGDSRWRAWAETRWLDLPVEFPDNFMSVNAAGFECILADQAAGNCTVAETFTSNPLENPETTPFRDGNGQRYGMSVSGGSETATYYLSFERDDETGTTQENEAARTNVRANLTGALNENLRVSARVGYTDSDIQFPQNDNSALGVLANGLTAPPLPFYTENWDGFALPREYLFAWDQFQDLTRFTGSASADWTPLSWLTLNGTAGIDNVNRHDNDILEPNVLLFFGHPFSSGFRESWRVNQLNYTGNTNATARYGLSADLSANTSIGTQYHRDLSHAVYAFGAGLTPGTGSIGGASSDFEADESSSENVTLGAYVQQQLSWRDRLYVTGAVRGDRNSAFGTNLGWVWYPAVSGSYVLSEEDWFPQQDVVPSLRLRAAWGQSGLRPTFRQALQYFSGVTAAEFTGEVPGFVIAGAGNPDLKPEISTELELGFEAEFLRSLAGVEFTWYRKESDDALVSVPLPPSFGATGTRLENIGSMLNTGVEAVLNLNPVTTPTVDWDLRFSLATNRNEVTSLGGNEDIIFGLLTNTQRHAEGFPAGAYFQPPITFDDANNDGIIEGSEVEVGIRNEAGQLVADSMAFLGSPMPKREISIGTNLRLWNMFALSGLLDFKGGHHLFNATDWDRCDLLVCRDVYDENTSLERQAAIMGWLEHGSVAGFIEEADFWKLRELSLSFIVPEQWYSRVRARDLRLTVAGANLATWTDYTGFDPEVNGAGQANFNTFDLRTLPPLRSWTIRLDVAF